RARPTRHDLAPRLRGFLNQGSFMFATRQSHRKPTASSVAGAFRINRSVVRFNEALHQGQPQAKAAMGARLGSIFLAKAIEDKRQKVRSDALTSILDTH